MKLCHTGCSTNAKQSQPVAFIPRALKGEAGIRGPATVGRIEMWPGGRATGAHEMRDRSWRFRGDNNKALIGYAPDQMTASLGLVGAKDIFKQTNDVNHLGDTARIGFDAETSIVGPNCRSWDIPNIRICDRSMVPAKCSANPSLTINAMAMRTAARFGAAARSGELSTAAERMVHA